METYRTVTVERAVMLKVVVGIKSFYVDGEIREASVHFKSVDGKQEIEFPLSYWGEVVSAVDAIRIGKE